MIYIYTANKNIQYCNSVYPDGIYILPVGAFNAEVLYYSRMDANTLQ
jgi:hypothetical protein